TSPGTLSTTITVSDTNGNPIGSGSTISIVQVSVSGVALTLSPSSGSSTTSFTEPDAGCTPPGSAASQVIFTITGTVNSGATTFGGTFYLQYTSSDGKTSVSSAPITVQ
ncbi:MAG TPA: hypothetical protein VGT42_07450, partial [Gammaproteobacteria bacterium]|nr:hypothetical protein [Gammaproteobacteria bacterium]